MRKPKPCISIFLTLKSNIYTLVLCIALLAKTRSQDLIYSNAHTGFNVSLNTAFGTHFQRLGVNLNFFYINRAFQANTELRAFINFKSLGPKKKYPELILAQGVLYGYGNKLSYFNPFISSVSNQTEFESSVAYSYNIYLNTAQTRQVTGIVSIEVKRFSLITENDILAHSYFDRFRTAAFLLQFQFEDKWQAAVNCTMWTGQYFRRHESDDPHFFRGCYMDTAGGVYTHLSHGLLSAQFKYNVMYSQNAQISIGTDAEQVRNVMQNKFIHDMKYVPRKWNKTKNCHLPMIDENGNPFIYNRGQKVRRPKPYLNVFSNTGLFY